MTVGTPSVSVPVLSKTTAFTLWAVSKLSADLIRMPFFAPCPVPTIIAVGVASPKAHGQEITRTETAAFSAMLNGFPVSSHTIRVTMAMLMTIGTKTPLILSAKRAIGALELPASSTKRIICERVVSAPTCSARYSR